MATKTLLCLGLLIGLTRCGARLPTEMSVNRPTGQDEALDFGLINFTDLESGATVNLKSFMDQKNLDFLLLTFGSKGCASCKEKSTYLQHTLVSNDYKILGDEAAKTFVMIGVNTDPARERAAVLRFVKDEDLGHIRWSDAGLAMINRYFLPKGRSFGIPLTVLLSRSGIKWRVANDDPLTPPELLQKLIASLGSDAVAIPPPPPPPTEKPQRQWPVASGLEEIKPGRLGAVRVSDCKGQDTNLVTLFGEVQVRVVLVDKEGCGPGSVCRANQDVLQTFVKDCQSRYGLTCEMVTLVGAAQSCHGDRVATGGGEFFNSFATHFNWRYLPDQDNKIPAVRGPVSLFFDEQGRVLFSKDAAVTAAELAQHFTGDPLKKRASTQLFTVRQPGQDLVLGAYLQQATYTIVSSFSRSCGACRDELVAWHQPGQLVDYCAARPGDCQILALETDSYFGDKTPDEELVLLKGAMGSSVPGFRLPLALDFGEVLAVPDARDFFKSYMSLYVGQVEYQNFIFDREGRLLGNFSHEAQSHDLFDALKKRLP